VSIEHLEAADLRQVVERYLDRLHRHRDQLDRLNVYPVPDGDTGTNMALTVEAVLAAADGAATMDDLADALAHGSLMGAQGNSGIILSQVLRGVAEVMRGRSRLTPEDLADALRKASRSAYTAVGAPAEGTILTVLRESAEAVAGAAESGAALDDVVRRGFDRSVVSLRETPDLLPVLAEAGVVDAGGAGLVFLLAALVEEVTGSRVEVPETLLAGPAVGTAPVAGEPVVPGPRYEVMFLLDASAGAGKRLRDAWAPIGESVVVVGGGGEWNCHIHTDDIGRAIEAGIDVGRPHRIVVTDLARQSADAAFHEVPFEPLPAFAGAEVGVVAVGIGDGVRALLRDAGAQAVVAGGQTMNPSVGVLLDAVEGVAASTVIVLPNNDNVIPAARQLDSLTRKAVHVVETRSIPEGLAAILAYHPDESPERLIEAMRRAAAGCRSGEMTRAVRAAATPVGEIAEGDWLGLVDGRVAAAGPDAVETGLEVVRGLLSAETELVTAILGVDADPDVVAGIGRWLERHRPDVEVEVHAGGQPLYPYLFGAE
jgi:hypothetical protein